MDVVTIRKAQISARQNDAREPHPADVPQPGTRALVVVEARHFAPAPRFTRHAAAPFLAQLIATRQQAPQTRARRRAEPEEATALYRSIANVTGGSGSRAHA
jgi:hypothetical protein